MAAGSIIIDLLLKTASFSTDTARASKDLKQFQRDAEDVGKKLGLAFTAGTVGLIALTKSNIDAADHLNDLSKKTGIAVDTLGGIGFAAKQSGGDLESAAAAAGKLNKSLAEAAAGNVEAAQAFKVLGINVKDAAGNTKTADTALAELADKFAGYADGPEKAALALRIFGKAGADIIPLLDDGGRALQENIDYYKRFSGVTVETAQKADAFNDTLGKLSLLSGAFGRTLAAELLGPMQALTEQLLAAKESGDQLKGAAHGLIEVVKGGALAAAYGGEQFALYGKSIAAVAASANLLAHADLAGARAVFKALGEDGDAARKRLEDLKGALYGVQATIGAGGGRGFVNPANVQASLPKAPSLPPAAGPAQALSDYDKLVKSIGEKVAADNAELASVGKLTEGQKLQAKVFADVDAGYLKLTLAQKLSVDARLQELLAGEKALDLRDREKRAIEDAAQALESFYQTQRQALDGFVDEAQAAKDSAAAFGLSKLELEKLASQRIRGKAAAKEALAIQAEEREGGEAIGRVYREQAAALRATADAQDALTERLARQQNDPLVGLDDAVKDYLDSIKRAGDDTYRTVSNSLKGLEDFGVQALTGGNLKDAARSLVNQLIAEFYRLQVVRPLLASLGSSGNFASLLASFGSGYNGSQGGINGGSTILPDSLRGGAATGTNLVQRDMVTLLHKGEAVVPKAYNPAAGGGSSGPSIVIENHGAEITQKREQGPSGEEFVRLIIRQTRQEVAAGIASGTGIEAQALKARGVSLAGGIPRRA